MTNSQTIWNGYPVHGAAKELDNIVESTGFIPLAKEDIIEVLSADGENYVVTGVNANISSAFSEAVDNLPCKMDNVNTLLIDFFCGRKQPDVSDLSAITGSLADASKDMSVKWGIASDESLGDAFKVVVVASLNHND